jgi:hypothetical protein
VTPTSQVFVFGVMEEVGIFFRPAKGISKETLNYEFINQRSAGIHRKVDPQLDARRDPGVGRSGQRAD